MRRIVRKLWLLPVGFVIIVFVGLVLFLLLDSLFYFTPLSVQGPRLGISIRDVQVVSTIEPNIHLINTEGSYLWTSEQEEVIALVLDRLPYDVKSLASGKRLLSILLDPNFPNGQALAAYNCEDNALHLSSEVVSPKPLPAGYLILSYQMEIILHEFGHAISFEQNRSGLLPTQFVVEQLFADLKATVRYNGHFSKRGQVFFWAPLEEDFAWSFSQYVLCPNRLSSKSPSVFQWLSENIFR